MSVSDFVTSCTPEYFDNLAAVDRLLARYGKKLHLGQSDRKSLRTCRELTELCSTSVMDRLGGEYPAFAEHMIELIASTGTCYFER